MAALAVKRVWSHPLTEVVQLECNYCLKLLESRGLLRIRRDHSLHSDSEGEMFVVAVYVDDIILGGSSMNNSKPVSSPVNPDVLVKTQMMSVTSRCTKQLYQAVVGSLLYLSTKTRPDIAYAVSNAACYCAKHTSDHWTAIKRILRYLKGTHDYGLLYRKNAPVELTGYSDSDWTGDIGDRKSGYVFLLGGGAISWKSSKQNCVALSTAEAEYVALSAASQEVMWLQQLVSDLINLRVQQTTILEDNQSTICLAKNPQVHGRTKHVDIKYYFVRDLVYSGEKAKNYFCHIGQQLLKAF